MHSLIIGIFMFLWKNSASEKTLKNVNVVLKDGSYYQEAHWCCFAIADKSQEHESQANVAGLQSKCKLGS